MRLLAAIICACAITCAAQSTNELRYFILVTGGELLEGVYADAHTPFITRTLHPLGGKCAGSMSVDDDRASMLAALAYATNRAPVVLVTGGLGPTANDITREVLSEFTGVPLRESEHLLRNMEARLGEQRDAIRPSLRKQTKVPVTGYFTNTSGTAAGLVFKTKENLIVALPGPPRELQPMVHDELIPYLQRNYDLNEHITRLAVRFYGIGQSQITQTLNDKIKIPDGAIVTSLFENMRVDFFFTLPEKNESARLKLDNLAKTLQQQLGNHIYAFDIGMTLEDAALNKLRKNGYKLLIIDHATGGAAGAALYTRPGASGVVAANLFGTQPERHDKLATKYKADYLLIIRRDEIEHGPLNELKQVRIPFKSPPQFLSDIFNELR